MMSYISSIDLYVLKSLHDMRDMSAVQALIHITELGDAVFVLGIVACLVLFYLMRARYSYAIGLLVSVASTAGTVYLLKHVIARARPDLWYRAYPVTGFSLPSGHAAHAAALYGFCMYLVWRSSLPRAWRIAGVTTLGGLTLLIAFSRIYLGVHYLSDVAAGVIIGGGFAWLGSWIATMLREWEVSNTIIARALFRRE